MDNFTIVGFITSIQIGFFFHLVIFFVFGRIAFRDSIYSYVGILLYPNGFYRKYRLKNTYYYIVLIYFFQLILNKRIKRIT